MSLLSDSEDFALRLAKLFGRQPMIYCNGCGEMERDWPGVSNTVNGLPRYKPFKVFVKYGHPPVYLCCYCNEKYEIYLDVEKKYREYLQSVQSMIGLFRSIE